VEAEVEETADAAESEPERLLDELDRLRLPPVPALEAVALCARAATAAATVIEADHGHDCSACERNLGGA
jgi:hypothetical protein